MKKFLFIITIFLILSSFSKSQNIDDFQVPSTHQVGAVFVQFGNLTYFMLGNSFNYQPGRIAVIDNEGNIDILSNMDWRSPSLIMPRYTQNMPIQRQIFRTEQGILVLDSVFTNPVVHKFHNNTPCF